MANTRQKSQGIMNSLRMYISGRKAKKEAERQKYREQYGPTLGDTVRDVGQQTVDNARDIAETVTVTGYVIYDNTKQKAADFYDKSKDKAHELSDKVIEASGQAKGAVTERVQVVRDNISLKRELYRERMNSFFNKVTDKYNAMKDAMAQRYQNSKETVLDKYNEAKDAVKMGATAVVGAGAMAYDRGVAAGTVLKEKATNTVESGRRSVAERLSQFADKLNPDIDTSVSNTNDANIDNNRQTDVPKQSRNDEPGVGSNTTYSRSARLASEALDDARNINDSKSVSDSELDDLSNASTEVHDMTDKGAQVTVSEATVSNSLVSDKDVDSLSSRQAGKAINRSIKALKNGDKDEALNRFAEWYMSLDNQNRDIVKDILDNKKEPTDVIGNAQAYRTRYGFDPKVGAIAFFNALREPTMGTHLATQDLKQATNDIDTYIDAKSKIEWADAVMTNVEGEYSFLKENNNSNINAIDNSALRNVYDGDIDEPVRNDPIPHLDTPKFVKEPDSTVKTPFANTINEYHDSLASQVPDTEPIMADPDGEVFLQSEQPNITFTANDVNTLKDLGKTESKSHTKAQDNDFGLTAADFASLQETEQASEAPFAL